MRKEIFIAFFLMLIGSFSLAAETIYGKFIGRVVAEWDMDGRRMKLMEEFQYIGPDSVAWDAPAGSIVDGASIPQIAWSVIGGPFEGKYRDASVIHDIACDQKSRPWQSVHEAFYTAMLARGVAGIQAKIMYAAVYHFGPRWPRKIEVKDAEKAKEVLMQKLPDEAAGKVLSEQRTRIVWESIGIFGTPSPRILQYEQPVVEFAPLTPQVSNEEFSKLEKAIKENDLTEEQIRSYFPQR